VAWGLLLLGGLAPAAEEEAAGSTWRDAEDGWVDLSGFLDTAYGFVPVVSPITEPAVGYGAAGALIFIDRNEPDPAGRYVRPNIGAVGGMATENDSTGLLAVHLGTWRDGRLKTQVGIADLDLNLEFFGLGSERPPGDDPLDYSVEARGGVAGVGVRWRESPLWLGLRYALVNTTVSLGALPAGLPPIDDEDRDLRLGMLTPSVTLDRRDNFFTPKRGWYVDLSVPLFREELGSDRDFERATLEAIGYLPVGEALFLAVRGSARTSTDGTPFFLRPYVVLRGVQALSYQGEQAADVEAELRWQFHPRFSLVGFAGAGAVWRDEEGDDEDEGVAAGGAGFRYLIARKYGLHMGLDVALGPEDPVIYVIFGNAWLRP
jgi:hypothetical protein